MEDGLPPGLQTAGNGFIAQTEEALAPDIRVHQWNTLREHLKKNPQDVESWMKLVDLAEELGHFEREKDTYEALLNQYPNTVSIFNFNQTISFESVRVSPF